MKRASSTIICCTVSMLAVSGYAAMPPQSPSDKLPVCAITSCETACCGARYELLGEYLFLQPNGSDLYYGVAAAGLTPGLAQPAACANWKLLEINPDYHSGFKVGAGVLFNANDIHVSASWERLYADDHESYTAPSSPGHMVGPLFDIGPNMASYVVAKGKVTFHFDQINLDVGKRFMCGDRIEADLYWGASCAHIKQSMNASYANQVQTISRFVNSSSTFIGAGPQMGLNYACRIWNYFSFNGSSIASLFMGQLKNNSTFQSYTPQLASIGNPQPNNQKVSIPNRAQLVPGFEQTLGFAYESGFSCVDLALEIGYRCQIYVNAVQTLDMTAPQVVPSTLILVPQVGVFAVGFERTLSNFMLTGPYASLAIAY